MRKLWIEFPNYGVKVSATMTDGDDQVLENNMWNYISEFQPVRFLCHHTGSTGGLIDCFPMPREEYPIIPVKNRFFLCDGKKGQIAWNGNQLLLLHKRLTEPLMVGLGVVAQIDDECMDEYMAACEDVWNHCFLYHKMATVVISGQEVKA